MKTESVNNGTLENWTAQEVAEASVATKSC